MDGRIDSWGKLNKQDQNHFFLPEELIIDILVRLPVKSLLCFKSVCKYWYHLITRSNFVDNHFNHHSNRSRLLVYHGAFHDPDMSVFSIFSEDEEKLDGEMPSYHHLEHMYMPEKYVEVIGPVNGVFCLCHSSDKPWDIYGAILVNPATRECKPLIVPHYSTFDPFFWNFFHMFGFGVDALTGDLKVVSVWCRDEIIYNKFYSNAFLSNAQAQLRAAVYSLANDSWTYHDLDPFIARPRSKILSSGTTCLNGSCYWMLNDKNKYYLRSFDLSSEVLREMKGPEYEPGALHPKLILYNDNSLAMMFYQWIYDRKGHIDIMVMKEEGYWTKDFSVDVRHLSAIFDTVGLWKNNILLHGIDFWQLISYDPITCEVRDLGIDKRKSYSGRSGALPYIYKESLVSLNGENIQYGIKHVFNRRAPLEHKSHNQSKTEKKDKDQDS